MAAASSILNADMATVGRWLGAGYAWWIAELSGLRGGNGISSRGMIARYSAPGEFQLFRHGRPVNKPKAYSNRKASAAIVLPREMGLVRTLDYPAVDERDLKRMVLLDSDRLLPVSTGSSYIDVALADRAGEGGRQQVLLAALPKQRAAVAIDAARQAGLSPRALSLEVEGGEQGLMFDFLPALHAESGVGPNHSKRFWWAVAGVLIILNLAAAILQDVRSVAGLRALVEEQSQAAGVARKITQRIGQEDARRAQILASRETANPLTTLAQVTEALPNGAWVQRYVWNGSTLRLSGYKQGDIDVLAALRRVPSFSNVRASTSDIPARQAMGEAFDVTLDLGGRGRR